MDKLKFLKDRKTDYNSNCFINELFIASKVFGVFEEKIASYKFKEILIPLLHNKEAISSMYIEGTQTTITDVLENELNDKKDEKTFKAGNYTKALRYGVDYLRSNTFTHSLIKNLHRIMLLEFVGKDKENTLGRYKTKDNFIVNSAKSIVFTPPPYKKTQKYMDELIDYMNDVSDETNPLIKAAIIHSQFESIHPFEDGNGRVGRMLISLYLFKAKVIKVPFFYISEAISQDKNVYYNKLTDSRKNDYTEWIRFFLKKCAIQAQIHIEYVNSLNALYETTQRKMKEVINTTKYEQIIECIFIQPILTADYFAERINVSLTQARRYLNALEKIHILSGNDRMRDRRFYFIDLLEIIKKS